MHCIVAFPFGKSRQCLPVLVLQCYNRINYKTKWYTRTYLVRQTSISPRYIKASLSNCLPVDVTLKFMTTRLKEHGGGVYVPVPFNYFPRKHNITHQQKEPHSCWQKYAPSALWYGYSHSDYLSRLEREPVLRPGNRIMSHLLVVLALLVHR